MMKIKALSILAAMSLSAILVFFPPISTAAAAVVAVPSSSSTASTPLLSSSSPAVQTLGPPRVVSVSGLPSLGASSGKTPLPTPNLGLPGGSGNQGVAQKQQQQQKAPAPTSTDGKKLKVLQEITGLDESQGGLYPPDVQSATGTTDVVEAINAAAGIWFKNGTSVKEFTLASFLGTGDFIGDPRIVYDVLSGHFFMSVADFYNNKVWIATTKTGDPTGTWYIYVLSTTSNPSAFTDQPTMGVSADKLSISANIYVNGGAPSYFFAINKQDLISGSSNPHYVSEQSSDFSVHPAHNYNHDKVMYFVSDQAGAVSSIDLFTLKGLPGVTKVHVSVTTLSIAYAPEPPSAPQKGTSSQINTDDGRMQDAAYYKGNLWLTFEDGCTPKGDSSQRSCLRMIELNATSPSVEQDFDIGAAKVYYYYPALSFTGNGGMVAVFGFSNSTLYPSIAVTGQAAGAHSGSWKSPVTVLSGKFYDTDGRYGDYFAAQMDPSQHSVVWVAGQYEVADSSWGTEIASVKL
jgi:hypothetical protein